MTETSKPIHAKPSLYAYYFEVIKEIGKSYGYNIILHGSLNRDLDLVAVPWQETLGDKDMMIDLIAKVIGGEILMVNRSVDHIKGDRYNITHHGRMQYVININRDMNYKYNGMKTIITEFPDPQYYIDISVIPTNIPTKIK
jgi:hypothetical protein